MLCGAGSWHGGLTAGNKSGVSQKRFYRGLSGKPIADSMRMSLASERRGSNHAVNVNEKIRKLSVAQRRKVESRAAELIVEEMILRELS